MKKRYKMSKRNSKRKFRRTAGIHHKLNYRIRGMRGGTRL